MNHKSFLCSAILLLLHLQVQGEVSVFPRMPADGFIINGLMPIDIVILNTSVANYVLEDQSPVFTALDFSIDGIKSEAVPFFKNSAQPIAQNLVIAPGKSLKFTVYLSDFYKFQIPGSAKVHWKIDVSSEPINVIPGEVLPPGIGSGTTLKASGEFSVNVLTSDDARAIDELQKLYSSLDAGISLDDQNNIARGICSIHYPLVIPFLDKVSHLSNLSQQAMAVLRLCNEWIGDEDGQKILDKILLSSKQEIIVQIIVNSFVSHRRSLTFEQVSHLLNEPDPTISFFGVWYVRQTVAAIDIKALEKLSNSGADRRSGESKEILNAFEKGQNLEAFPQRVKPDNNAGDQNGKKGF